MNRFTFPMPELRDLLDDLAVVCLAEIDDDELAEIEAETARRQHFDDMAARCYDDPDFALAYEEDAREFRGQ
jgi:hypothetical protein